LTVLFALCLVLVSKPGVAQIGNVFEQTAVAKLQLWVLGNFSPKAQVELQSLSSMAGR